VNAYDQLNLIRERLEDREAGPETIRLVDKAITLAEPERDNPLSISEQMMIRHLMKMSNAINSYYIQNDLEGLLTDIDNRRTVRHDDDVPDATAEGEKRPMPHSYYKTQKQRQSN